MPKSRARCPNGPSLSSRDDSGIIDLHDMGVLLNYERALTEPRFRHAKLRDVATTQDHRPILCMFEDWHAADPHHRLGLTYERLKQKQVRYRQRHHDRGKPDLPTNMFTVDPVDPSSQGFNRRELESIYWRTRNHNAAFNVVRLLQLTFDLFPPETSIRVRTAPSAMSKSKELVPKGSKLDNECEPPQKPTDYLMLAKDCKLVEFDVAHAHELTVVVVFPEMAYVTGGVPTAKHWVVGLSSNESNGQLDTVLDLSSMQYGDAGRGNGGDGLFVFEPIQDYEFNRLPSYVRYNTLSEAEIMDRAEPTPDDEYLRVVAKRAKKRWDERATVPFCAQCGAPPQKASPMTLCSACRSAHYCTKEHQLNAWSLHKHFCPHPGPGPPVCA